MQISERRDAQRLALALVAAILVHAGLYFGIPFLTSLDTAPLPDYGPIVVTLEEPAGAVEPPAPVPTPPPAPRPTPAPKASPALPAVPPKPAETKPATAAAATTAAPATGRAPGTSAFRQAGATTGTSTGSASASIVSGPPPVTLPAVGTTAPGAAEQRSGEAVLLSGKPPASGTSLDTGVLDASLARAGTAGGTSTTAVSAGGTGTDRAAAAEIEWEDPDAAKGRQLLSAPLPRLPDWVKEQGFDLEVRIDFSVSADGLVTDARVRIGSGYADVDAACLEALQKYRFSSSAGASTLKGSRIFRTKLR